MTFMFLLHRPHPYLLLHCFFIIIKMPCNYFPLNAKTFVFSPLPVENMRLGSQISHIDPEWCLGATLTTVVYLWLTTLSSAVQESGLVFPGQFARLTHRVQHSEFFFVMSTLRQKVYY